MIISKLAASVLLASDLVSGLTNWFVADGPCQQDAAGCITSPNYNLGGNYGADGCTISVPADFVNVRVEAFDTEVGLDFLHVNDREYSGSMLPQADFSGGTAGQTVIWSSDDGVAHSGWKICPKSTVTADLWSLTSGDPCTMDGQCIQSPNFPKDYGNNQQCTITIPAGFPGADFVHFDTEVSDKFTWPDNTVVSGGISRTLTPHQGDIVWATDNLSGDRGWKLCPVEVIAAMSPGESMPANAQAAMDEAMRTRAVKAAMGLSALSKNLTDNPAFASLKAAGAPAALVAAAAAVLLLAGVGATALRQRHRRLSESMGILADGGEGA